MSTGRALAWAGLAVILVVAAVPVLAGRMVGGPQRPPVPGGPWRAQPRDGGASGRRPRAAAHCRHRGALDRIETLVAEQNLAPAARHQLVHELGRRSFGYAGGDVRAAFGACDARFNNGCYHGALQAFVLAQPQRALAELPWLCSGVVVAADATALLRFQSQHGLGHGPALLSPGAPDAPLRQCDALGDDARTGCYGGVFMEHVLSAAGRTGYTCDSVAPRYQEQCFGLAPTAVLLRTGGDLRAAFAECDAAPARYVPTCYRSMGSDILSRTQGDGAQVTRLCELGDRARCLEGAAAHLVDRTGTASPALAFCAATPVVGRSDCFERVGLRLHALFPEDSARRAQECATADPAGHEPCRWGAGVP